MESSPPVAAPREDAPLRACFTALRIACVTVVLCAVIYPLVVTGLARLAFPARAAGSLIYDGATVRGAELIGQNFTRPGYFHGRPSAAGAGYDPTATGGTNLGPASKKLVAAIEERERVARRENPAHAGEPVPADLLTASASGIDPYLSPEAARFQIERVARARGLLPATVAELVARNVRPRVLGVFGEPRVNIVQLNRALDAQTGRS